MTKRHTLALVGASLLLGFAAPGQVAFGQTPEHPRMLPEVIPADVEHGSVSTPLGRARWVHLVGDPASLPDPLQPMAGRSGLVWFDWGGTRFVPCEGSTGGRQCEVATAPRLWTSDDALSTRVEHQLPADVESAGLWQEGDTFWLTTTGPTTLWRSTDLDDWEGFDTSALESPGPSSLAWDMTLGIPATSGGVTVVPVAYAAQDLGRLVGLPGTAVHIESAGPGRYKVSEHHLRSEGGDRDAGFVSVTQTPTGIRFWHEDGSAIAEVEGAGLEMVERWAELGSILEYQLGVLDGTTIEPVAMPGHPALDPSGQGLTIFPVEAGFLGLQIDADHTVRTWRSTDGRTWVEGDRLHGPDGTPWRTEWVGADWLAGRHEISISPMDESDGDTLPRPWTTADGDAWTRGPQPSTGEDGLVFPLSRGSLRLADDGSWWASADGASWDPVAGLDEAMTKSTPDGAGSAGGSTVGDAMFFAVEESEGSQQRDLWIVELDAPTGDD